MSDRPIDKAATKAARERQAAGMKRLDDLFGLPSHLRALRGIPLATSIRPPYMVAAIAPLRHNPRCPRRRTDVAWLRKRRRRASRLARRANRG